MNPITHLYYRNMSQKLELQLENLQALHDQAFNNLLEAKKAKKDYNKNGKLESPKKEWEGARDNAIKKNMGKKSKFPKHDPNDPEIERLRYGPVD